jgi:hypothetical protein
MIAHSTVALAIVTFLLAVFTGCLWWSTYKLGRDAKSVSDRQAADTLRSLAIAADTTAALREVTDATRNNTALLQPMLQKQMRAYLSVNFGGAIYQDERLRFAATPVIENTGLSPAQNVSFRATAGILDVERAAQMDFPLGEIRRNDATLHPRQSFTINVIVPDRYADDDAAAIMRGDQRGLFVWGAVVYDDVYGEAHETKFCHRFVFFPDAEGKIRQSGFYNTTHNSST